MVLGVCDFFSGCGGTSRGFQEAGLAPVFALDSDRDAADTFRANFPEVAFSQSDITQFDTSVLDDALSSNKTEHTLFSGCAPCQPFTAQNTVKIDSKKDPRRSLLSHFGNLVDEYRPDYVFVENVPGIQRVIGNSTLNRFKARLEALGYKATVGIIDSRDYGVPQRRRRLVLLASRHGQITLPEPTHGPSCDLKHSTVRKAIEHFPAIRAGEVDPAVPNHRAAKLSFLNLTRIAHTPPEGSRMAWPEDLHLICHGKSGYTGHTDVYGRMKWDKPAPTLTTKCTSLSNGRYGHPVQNRAISVREAAALQTFSEGFVFSGPMTSQARQVGNAVPVLLAKAIGRHILSHFKHFGG